MRAVSLRQPWAWLASTGRVGLLNQAWNTAYRGEFLIGSGQKLIQRDYRETAAQLLDQLHIEVPPFDAVDLVPRGGIVGIDQGKGQGRSKLLVKWSPALRAAIAACAIGDKIGHVLKSERGTGYRYSGIRSSWDRLCERAKVEDLHIHDLRGRAGVDALLDDEGEEDIKAAQNLLGHKSEGMTRHYVDGKYHRRVKPSR